MAKQPISDAAETFGARVRARRNELGKSQERLADDSGMHWTFIGQVERGQRNVSLHNILKLAEALGVDAAELVRGLKSSGQCRRRCSDIGSCIEWPTLSYCSSLSCRSLMAPQFGIGPAVMARSQR
ncbi:helix-turn-helix domain-containing protein [Streptomyces sp. L7]